MNPRYLTFGFLHFFFSFVGQTFFISLFVARMTERMDWGESTFASLYSGVTLVAAFILPLIGRQIDRLKVRYVSTVTAFCLIVGTLLLAFADETLLLVAGLFVVRLGGQGVLPLIGSTTIGRFFNARRGRALALSIIGLSVAEVLLPPLATYAMVSYGYGPVWLMAGCAVLLIFVPAVWLLVRRYDDFQRADTVAEAQRREAPAAVEEDSWTRTQVLKDRRFQLILPIILFIPFVFTGLVFNQSVIAEQRGYTAETMAYGLSAYGLVRVAFLLFGGDLIDRVGPTRLLRFVLLPAVAGLLVLLLVEDSWSVPVFFGLMAVSGGMDSVNTPALWAERYGPRFLGSIKSTVRLFVVVSSAAAPILFSYGLRWGLQAWLGILVAYGLACVGLAVAERRT
ncbi:putative MFS family arabinose efflux permease [Lewinella marina]|uniref:MFS transporter n=1 Tax=Neolewinella marina TaxID=438751 RepID=A0A2G0CBL7_9BACT|nr:MFS transporter [Neolewinella marina]NJB87092.1 putative MFS family arabinose efflux permease [Neolewinella marina]PHK97378.1 MFS transporter [Neolewinella marina]